jgi:hypothetical protein
VVGKISSRLGAEEASEQAHAGDVATGSAQASYDARCTASTAPVPWHVTAD